MSLPDRALSNYDLQKAVKDLKIKKFRGVYVRDTLPKKPWNSDCGIINLDDSCGGGTHWIAWVKRGSLKVVVDSFGLGPPLELMSYLGIDVYYNTLQVQKENTYVCGQIAIFVLVATSNSTETTLLRDTQLAINKLF